MKNFPDIFNDVIGPVMRGPSSSHTAASWRIARTCLEILNDQPSAALIEFDKDGAWAPNYREQGTCMGIEGGLLGLAITDAKMKDTAGEARKQGITIRYRISSFPTNHANTVRLRLDGKAGRQVQVVAVSRGGGAFEIQSVNDFKLSFNGDAYALLAFAREKTVTAIDEQRFTWLEKDGTGILYCSSSEQFSPELISNLKKNPAVIDLAVIHPVLPVLAGQASELPFQSIESLESYAQETKSDLGDLGLLYEKCLSGLAEQELNKKMENLVQVIHNSIDTGLAGTKYKDRILHQQSHLIKKAEREGKLKDSLTNRIIANVTALMESKSAMEVVVAVPTAGSCGTVGGALRAVAEDMNASREQLVKAYFAAGIVGAWFAMGPGFSAEEHGCQVECGAASGMAAAAIAQLMGATAKQAIGAASMAIQNMIGLVCDPVADRVEVPCLGKNISAAVNAQAAAIMCVSGFDPLIPLDQVIETVSRVSKTMPTCVKCTGRGGLALTDTALKLKKKLN